MPHALTERQKEYLEFIRNYILENESSPRLDEIANHFSVKAPTAHKVLKVLQSKGYLYFGRDSISGFFIRLIERAGSAETIIEIAIAGKIDHLGEIHDFPEKLGHFATVLPGSNPDEVFALVLTEDMTQASMLAQDFIVFDTAKKPLPGDICIAPIGERLFLIQIASKTFDDRTPSPEMAQQYPIPEKLSNPDLGQELHWYPLAYDDDTQELFAQIAEEQRWPVKPLSPDLIVATALRLVRALTF
jgi:SOS-response transcriptional repressor LexA